MSEEFKSYGKTVLVVEFTLVTDYICSTVLEDLFSMFWKLRLDKHFECMFRITLF